MTSTRQASIAPISRAPKINGSIATPIRLSPDEYAEANEFAEAQERSRSSFMRSMYLRGLKSLKAEIASTVALAKQ
ncbi:hypothetical protein [Undibacterium danionis]|uniref:Ribbon-helix-helix protein, CopG family n=1 Tax=Undibacterium danionis TaxID=1812100 RepID=A0ABV6IJ39_9BURK